MTTTTVLFASGNLKVTTDYIRTARETIFLADVDKISVKRPLLFVLLPAGALLTGLWGVFREDWYPNEAAVLLGFASLFAVLALTVGELKVHSLSLRDESVFGPIWRLRQARSCVEDVIFNASQSRPTSRGAAAHASALDTT